MAQRRFDESGQPLVEETGPKTRALAVRSWGDSQEMPESLNKIFGVLAEHKLRFVGTGSVHHYAGEREKADTVVLFECDDRTYAQIRRDPTIVGSRELALNKVMRQLDADVMQMSVDEAVAVREQYKANIIERLMLQCTSTAFHIVTSHLAKHEVASTGTEKPKEMSQRNLSPCKIYIQNIENDQRAALEQLLHDKNIDGAWSNKTTVRLVGNFTNVMALQKDLCARFGDRVDRLDLGPVSVALREEDRRETVRVSESAGG